MMPKAWIPVAAAVAVITTGPTVARAQTVSDPVYTQLDTDQLARWQRDPHRAIVKVHGNIDQPRSIILTLKDYREAKFSNASF